MAQVNVSRDEYLAELLKELKYHTQGGTPYRKKTAELAYSLAVSTSDPYTFWVREDTLLMLFKRLSNVNSERARDVAKMLSVVLRDLHKKKNLPSDTKSYVAMKMKKQMQRPLAFTG